MYAAVQKYSLLSVLDPGTKRTKAYDMVFTALRNREEGTREPIFTMNLTLGNSGTGNTQAFRGDMAMDEDIDPQLSRYNNGIWYVSEWKIKQIYTRPQRSGKVADFLRAFEDSGVSYPSVFREDMAFLAKYVDVAENGLFFTLNNHAMQVLELKEVRPELFDAERWRQKLPICQDVQRGNIIYTEGLARCFPHAAVLYQG